MIMARVDSVYQSGYVTSLAFHRNAPSILAGGTSNGYIIVWDISCSGQTIESCPNLDGDFYLSGILAIEWLEATCNGPTQVRRQ